MLVLLSYGDYAGRLALSLTNGRGILLIALLGLILLGFVAQSKVATTFNKYSRTSASCGLSASQVAEALLRSNGSSVRIQMIRGSLTDNFNPKTGCVSLSESVYPSSSISALAVAAHECGHVMQYEKGYGAIRFRNALLPAANIGSHFSYLLVILGLFLGKFGYVVSLIGVALFAIVFLFQLITLPIELNASSRAITMLVSGGYIRGREEEAAARKVLRAAAFTYVVAVLSAAVSLLRLFAIANSGRRR
jgi:Zn-dependent membrane protease YugP